MLGHASTAFTAGQSTGSCWVAGDVGGAKGSTAVLFIKLLHLLVPSGGFDINGKATLFVGGELTVKVAGEFNPAASDNPGKYECEYTVTANY